LHVKPFANRSPKLFSAGESGKAGVNSSSRSVTKRWRKTYSIFPGRSEYCLVPAYIPPTRKGSAVDPPKLLFNNLSG
jgi:hypothetical protein